MTTPVPGLRFPRGRRGTATVLVALLVIVVAGAAGYLAVMAALHRPVTVVDTAPFLDFIRTTPYDSTAALVIGISLAVLGLVVLAAAVVPAARRVEELAAPDPDVAVAITPTGLRRTLAAAAVGVDGVTDASARVGARRVQIDAVTPLRRIDGLQDTASTAVSTRLDRLALRRPRVLATRLHQKDN